MQAAARHEEYEIYRMKAPKLQVAIIIIGVFMAILDTSIVNVAIPTMETAFNATTAQIQWVMTGYMLMIGVLVPISGWLTDRFGAKHLFLFSLVMFTIGSALCGAAWNTPSIIVFRLIQALGGGFMMPVAQAMIFRIYPPDRRGVVMGLFGVSIMVAPAFGPTLSGYLVDYASWRFIFYINVPVGIVAIILGLLFMQELDHAASTRFDTAGFTLSTVGFFSLLYGLNNVPSDGWHAWQVLVFVVFGVICIAALLVVESIVPNPMIQLRVFKDYMFSMSVLLTLLINVALFAGIFFLPIYLQTIVGLSAVRTGLLMMPAALASAVVMPISGRLFNRIGARPLGIIGLGIVTLATLGFTQLGRNTSVDYVQWLYVLRMVGMGMTMMPMMTAGMNTLPKKWLNQGSGVSNTARQVASSLGTAVLTTVLTQRERFHFGVMAQNLSAFSPQAQQLTRMQGALQAQGVPAPVAHTSVLQMMVGVLEQRAFVMGLNDAFLIAAVITAAALVGAFFFASKKETAVRRGSQGDGSPSAADGSKKRGASAVPVME